MDLQHLCIENFMNHRRTDIDCTKFDSVLIIGQNKNNLRESNGVGKTAIFKAIDYAIFDVIPSDTIDEIVRDGCSQCKVTAEFIVKSIKYKVVRIRNLTNKKTYVEFYKQTDDNWLNISQRTAKDTNDDILKIIGLNYETFKNSILFSQSDLSGIASEAPGKRKEILREVLGLAIYKKFEKIAKEDIKTIKNRIDIIEGIISNMGDPNFDLKKFESDIIDINEKIENTNVLLSELQLEFNNNNQKLNELQQQLNSDISVINNRLNKINEEKTIINNSDIPTIINSLNSKQSTLSSLNADKEQKCYNLNLVQLQLDTEQNEKYRELDLINLDIETTTKQIADKKNVLFSCVGKIKELRTPFPDGDKCPYCRQELSAGHKNKCIEDINDKLLELEKEEKQIKSDIKQLEDKLITYKAENASVQNHTTLIRNFFININKISNDISNTDLLINQIVEIIDQKTKELEDKDKLIEELNNEEIKLQKKLAEYSLNTINNNIEKITKQTSILESKIKYTTNELMGLNSTRGGIVEKIETKKKDINIISIKKQELSDLEKKNNIYKHVIYGFSSNGIPMMIIYNVLDELQIETNALLSELRPGLEVQFLVSKDDNNDDGETLDITFKVNGKQRSYKLLSGGQKFLFSVSIKLGLSKVIQRRLGVDLKFLELDEVDQALDKEAVDMYANAIKKLQKEFKIFVITHNDKLKEKFNHVILVENDGDNGATSKLVDFW